MARKKTLLSLLQDYRAEIRASGNAAHNTNVRETQVRLLQRVQEYLYDEIAWPHLRIQRTFDVQAGQRYYAPPDEINLDRVELLEVRYGQQWFDLCPGIEAEHYNTWESDLDERSWPVQRWQIYEDEQIEIWPIPASDADTTTLDGRIRVTGIRKLSPLVQDDDTADLDDRLIVLYAAAETLAASGASDAQLKLSAAQQRKQTLTGNWSKKKTFRLFGGGDGEGWKPKGPPTVHYRDRQTS